MFNDQNDRGFIISNGRRRPPDDGNETTFYFFNAISFSSFLFGKKARYYRIFVVIFTNIYMFNVAGDGRLCRSGIGLTNLYNKYEAEREFFFPSWFC